MDSQKQRIFEVIKANTLKVLADVRPEQVTPETALSDLGANSVDRVEVVMYSMEDLGLSVPPGELHAVANLRGLVEVLHRHSPAV
jgi:polyketide biosynthesis acyl carrier protein